MSDPIEKLSRLGDAMEGAPMPLPATAIRARGDQIRRRKHALIAGASAAVVAAVAIPVAAFTLNSDDKADPDFTPQPTVTDPVAPAALSADNLVTDEDAGAAYGGAGDWVSYDTYRGDGQNGWHPCAPEQYAALSTVADPVFKREFNLDGPGTGWMTAIAGDFPSEAAARAYDDLSTALAECPDTIGTNYGVESEEDVTVGLDGEARRILASYVTPDSENARILLETGLVLTGGRLEVVVSGVTAQDYDFDNPPMETILPKAALRLAVGDGAGAPSQTADPTEAPSAGDPTDVVSGPAATTTVRDDFPIDLALGETPEEGAETTIDGPAPAAQGARGLTACGTALPFPSSDDADPAHELSYSISTIGGFDGRTLHAYPTAQDATDTMDALRAGLQGCARDNGGDGISDRLFASYASATGYDSETFGWSYEATASQPAGAGDLYTVIRVGSAILTIVWGSEGSVESMADSAPNQVELARLIGDEMACDFSVDGC